MVKTVIILLLMVWIAPGTAAGDELNGHVWDGMDASGKYLLLAGYLSGFWHGTVYGADFGVNRASKYLKDLGSSPVYGVRVFKDHSLCGANLDKNREVFLKAAAKYARNSLDKSVDYYVAEVDSFYRRYPLCKDKNLMEMLTGISLAWLNISTYKNVGEGCSENE